MSIIDDYSRMTWVFMMKHKSEAFKNFKQWKILIENQTGKKIKRLRIDNGLEFCGFEFNEFCKAEGHCAAKWGCRMYESDIVGESNVHTL